MEEINNTEVLEEIEEGLKYDSGKLRWSLLPMEPIEQIVQIPEFGAKKYTDNSWQQLENGKQRYYDALQRHLYAHYTKKEKNDPESNLPHLSHALTNCMFLLYLELRDAHTDPI